MQRNRKGWQHFRPEATTLLFSQFLPLLGGGQACALKRFGAQAGGGLKKMKARPLVNITEGVILSFRRRPESSAFRDFLDSGSVIPD